MSARVPVPRFLLRVARCAGVATGKDWLEPCKTCARRLSPSTGLGMLVYMAPPLMDRRDTDECEARI